MQHSLWPPCPGAPECCWSSGPGRPCTCFHAGRCKARLCTPPNLGPCPRRCETLPKLLPDKLKRYHITYGMASFGFSQHVLEDKNLHMCKQEIQDMLFLCWPPGQADMKITAQRNQIKMKRFVGIHLGISACGKFTVSFPVKWVYYSLQKNILVQLYISYGRLNSAIPHKWVKSQNMFKLM